MEQYIEDCLNSIVKQIDINKSDFEVIVVNDGSKDNTSNIVREFISNNDAYNITIIDKDNEGVSIARNTGLYAAKGDFVWFIDPDDCISNDALKYIIDTIKSFNVQFILIGQLIYNILQSDGKYKDYQEIQRISSLHKIVPAYEVYKMRNFFHHAFIWNREFLISNNLHYPEYITNNEDFFFLMKAIYKADMAYINSTYQFYYYRELIDSASRTKNKFDRIDRFMRNRYILLSELSKMYKYTKNSESIRDKYFNAKFIEFQADAVVILLRSGAPLYFIKYYLKELSQLGCYPLTNQTMNATNYYYPIFNNRIIYYVISVINRLNNIPILKKWTIYILKKLNN